MIAALIQVRKDSSRFPNKAFAQFGNSTVISHVINKVKQSKYFTPIVLTTNREIDNDLVDIAKKENALYFQGDLNNVAKRAHDCIIKNHISIFARINADCPFLSVELLDNAFENMILNGYDFASNILERTYPYGVSVEVFKADIFIKNYPMINTNDSYKEHLTSYFYKSQGNFNYQSIKLDENFHDISLTIDYPEDIIVLREIYDHFPTLTEQDYHRLREFINNKKQIKND